MRSILEQAAADEHIRIAIGSEGGFTEEEAARAIVAGWIPANLGPRILRIETAAIFLPPPLLRCIGSASGS